MNFISERQNADGTYGNEKTAKAVLVCRLTGARRRDLHHPDFAATFWPGVEISQRIETTGNEAGGDMRVHADGLAPGRYVDAGDHDAEQRTPSCAQYRFDDLKFPSSIDLAVIDPALIILNKG
jgi:hypothetical protein